MNNINQEIQDLEATLVSLKAKAKAQEPTLTPVSFESKGDLAKALVDGRAFKTTGERTLLYYEDNSTYLSPFRTKHPTGRYHYMRREWDSYDNLQEINAAPAEPWYLNIPREGVECYVSDVDPNPYLGRNSTGRVTKYDHSLIYPFQCYHADWKYATPVNEGK